MKSQTSPKFISALAGALIIAGLATSFFTMRQKSPIVDESVHLASGYSYFATRNFRMNPEHPPLVKEIAAIPLLFMHVESKTDGPYFKQSQLWNFGPEFVYHNTHDGESLIYAGRTMMLLFFGLLGLLVFRWTRELFGESAALISLTLTMFAPNFLAHASLITTDVPITFAYLFTSYTLWKYLEKPDRSRLAWFIFAFVFATLTKYTTVTLVIAILVVLVAHSVVTALQHQHAVRSFVHDLAYKKIPLFLLVGIITFLSIVVFYGINYQAAYQGEDTLRFLELNAPAAYRDSLLWFAQNIRIPGYYFFEGLISVLSHNKGGHESFILGDFGTLGWWYYFPFLALVKSTIISLVVLLVTFGSSLYHAALWLIRDRSLAFLKSKRLLPIMLLILPLATFVFFSLESNINLGIRHFLIFFPFMFILSGAVTRHLAKPWWGRLAIVVLFIGTGLTTARNFPNALSYFNPLLGRDPAVVSFVASDSNIDWGQDLKELGAFVERNNIQILYLAYFGTARPDAYGIDASYMLPPITDGTSSGYVAISETLLKNPEFASYHAKNPVAILGGSLYIYSL